MRLLKIFSLLMLISFQKALPFAPFNSKPYLTPTETPTNSIWINWNSENPESSIVAYGSTPALGDTVRLSNIGTYHHISISGLQPSTEYYYKVFPFGEVKSFMTFPLCGDTFSFIAFGDTRTDSVAHQNVINRMATRNFSLFMHAGDLIANGSVTTDWITFFNIEDTLLQTKHFLPAIGNHEFPYWPYCTLFALPEYEIFYSVNYGNAHFITLNTETNLYGDQLDWLLRDLEIASSDTSIDWIFVNLHRPPFSSGYHGSQLDVRYAWCPFFGQYGVDVVFAGHDHDYERTIPLDGVVYIVTGGGGAPLRSVGFNWWTAYSEMTYHFCFASITGKKLSLKAMRSEGSICDSLIIDKTQGIGEWIDPERNIDMKIIKNPALGNSIEIEVQLLQTSDVEFIMYNLAGQKYLMQSFRGLHAGQHRISLDVSRLSNGIYFLRLADIHYHQIEKVVLLK